MSDAQIHPDDAEFPNGSKLEPLATDEGSQEQDDGAALKDATPGTPKRRAPKRKSGGGLQADWATLKCHEKVYNVMFDPNSGTAAKIFTVFMTTIVVVSIVVFCMGTMPEFSTPERVITFDTADDIFNIVFTIEFVVRVAVILPRGSCPQKELVDFFMVVDFLAILPAIIGWFSGRVPFSTEAQPDRDKAAAAIFLLLKSLKSLRLLKLLRFFNEAVILTKALKKSGPALMVPAFAIIISATVFGSFVFVFEKIGAFADPTGPDAAFDSIPHTMWFMFVTMTTIGYGDVSPSTHVGKAVTVPVMVFGVLLISMPLAVVGNNFTEVWAEKDKVIFVEKLRQLIEAQGLKPNAVQIAFKELDTDNSGTISFKEFKGAIKTLQIMMPSGDVLKLWRSIDIDNSGEILVNELVEMIAAEGAIEKEPDYNPVFKTNRALDNGSKAFNIVHVDDEGKVHYRSAEDRADLPAGSQEGFNVKWLKNSNVTEDRPPPGSYEIDFVDEQDTVILPAIGSKEEFFSFDNLCFVFSFDGAGDDRVYLSNSEGHVDNVNTDPVGFPVNWLDKDNAPCAFPSAHPVGFEIISIENDETVVCKVEATSSLYRFHNPVHNIEFHFPSQTMTVKELEETMNARFDKLEALLQSKIK